MPEPDPASSSTRKSWSDLPQSGSRRATTSIARARRWRIAGRLGLGMAVLLVLGAAVGLVVSIVRQQGPSGPVSPSPTALTEIEFSTDGVLKREWFEAQFGGDHGRRFNEIDLPTLRRRVESFGQVREVALAVELPNRLKVSLKERQPVLRARVLQDKRPVDLLIATDGVVYQGHGYSAETLQWLPHVSGVRIARQGDGFAPIPGMETVAELLELGRTRVPAIYRTWRVVSLDRFARGDPAAHGATITIRGHYVVETIFEASGFEAQLEKLVRLVEYALAHEIRQIERVDLSFPDQAVVEFPAPNPARRARR